jgi:hypothetical protein
LLPLRVAVRQAGTVRSPCRRKFFFGLQYENITVSVCWYGFFYVLLRVYI